MVARQGNLSVQLHKMRMPLSEKDKDACGRTVRSTDAELQAAAPPKLYAG
jgi:hypothetical protein